MNIAVAMLAVVVRNITAAAYFEPQLLNHDIQAGRGLVCGRIAQQSPSFPRYVRESVHSGTLA